MKNIFDYQSYFKYIIIIQHLGKYTSSISAGMNALAAVCITDFIRPNIKLTEKTAGIVTRVLGKEWSLKTKNELNIKCSVNNKR